MPGLYGITSNANISVYNTTGLYNLSNGNVILGNVSASNSTGLYAAQSNVYIPSTAQTLLNLLYNNGNVNFALYGSNQVQAFAEVNPASIYSNANVTTFLAHFGSNTIVTTGNITAGNIITAALYYANGSPYNFGSTYSNANVASYLPVYGGTVLVNNITTTGQGVSIGQGAGITAGTIAIGYGAGQNNQGNGGLGLGFYAAQNNQSTNAVAIGNQAGQTSQQNSAVAVGNSAGQTSQQYGAVAIGENAGYSNQGANAVALGHFAGSGNQPNNSIFINASGTDFNGTNSGLYINPVRNDLGNVTLGLFYNSTTKEITYATIPATYGNSNVAIYLASNTDPTISNLNANAASQAVSINGINANVGAYETWANAAIQTTNANLGAFEIYANFAFGPTSPSSYSNANVIALLPVYNGNVGGLNFNATGNVQGTYFLGNGYFLTGVVSSYGNANVAAYLPYDPTITGIQANIGAYEIYANANAASQQTQINTNTTNLQTLNANVGAFETYANANIGSISTSLQTLNANVGAFETYANANAASQAVSITSLATGANANTAAYLTTATVSVGNLITTNGVYWSNGSPYSSGSSTYSNVNVAAYIPTDPTITTIQANIGAYQIYANGNATTQALAINSLNANLTAFETYANATFATGTGTYSNANVNSYLLSLPNVIIGSNSFNNSYQGITIGANSGASTYNVTNYGPIIIGANSAQSGVGAVAVAVGHGIGNKSGTGAAPGGGGGLGTGAVAVGHEIGGGGLNTTGVPYYSTWLGYQVGLQNNSSGYYSTAIGYRAGWASGQGIGNNSIILSGGSTGLSSRTDNAFSVSPVRTDSGNVNLGLFYNTTTSEITYSAAYGNANVATYIPTDPTITTLQANVGAFETYANLNFGNTSVGAFLETYSGNIGSKSYTNLYTFTANSTFVAPNIALESGATLTINALLVGGGGGGGGNGPGPGQAGGGGGGGAINYLTNISLTAGASYPIVVGTGGLGQGGLNGNGASGGSTTFAGYTAAGGGGGIGIVGTGAGGSTSSGGDGATAPVAGVGAGGGGGSGGAGTSGSNPGASPGTKTGGGGGNGTLNSITGSAVYYGGGGGGASGGTGAGGAGGLGGGSAGGGFISGGSSVPGTNGLGGGGGGEYLLASGGGNGGSGVVIISYTINNDVPDHIVANTFVIDNAGIFWANGVNYSAGISSAYGNTQVAAYLPTDPTIYGIQANIGGSEIYANVTFATKTALQTLDANVGAYEIATNANLGTATTNITTLFATAATQAVSLNTINANLGAFETYANATFGTSSYGNLQVGQYLTSGATAITANLGNVITTSGVFWANGTAYSSGGGTYGNTQVAAFNQGTILNPFLLSGM